MIRDASEVAILRNHSDPPSKVVEIASVRHAGEVFIELNDGRKFATIGGIGLNTVGYIVEARAEHHRALSRRQAVA